jgi:hypothetical protein
MKVFDQMARVAEEVLAYEHGVDVESRHFNEEQWARVAAETYFGAEFEEVSEERKQLRAEIRQWQIEDRELLIELMQWAAGPYYVGPIPIPEDPPDFVLAGLLNDDPR